MNFIKIGPFELPDPKSDQWTASKRYLPNGSSICLELGPVAIPTPYDGHVFVDHVDLFYIELEKHKVPDLREQLEVYARDVDMEFQQRKRNLDYIAVQTALSAMKTRWS